MSDWGSLIFNTCTWSNQLTGSLKRTIIHAIFIVNLVNTITLQIQSYSKWDHLIHQPTGYLAGI